MESKGLSKNIRSMKFMQRRAEALAATQRDEERAKMLKEAQWVAKEDVSALSIEERKVVFSAEKKTGRRSFGNFNPTIEKLQGGNTDAPKKTEFVKTPEKGTIQDEEFAERYKNAQEGDDGLNFYKNRGKVSKKRKLEQLKEESKTQGNVQSQVAAETVGNPSKPTPKGNNRKRF
eukprot:TRINITY_DN10387_c0_g1_i2.p1 TRINITY_DN10387_c0_g1~~TRINITY_DN10387_c0_g1_i2.p1  ORF type:complete len:175 (-),score=37.92 TRINITY_DN10387_c0_g1_i2:64-588(-)